MTQVRLRLLDNKQEVWGFPPTLIIQGATEKQIENLLEAFDQFNDGEDAIYEVDNRSDFGDSESTD